MSDSDDMPPSLMYDSQQSSDSDKESKSSSAAASKLSEVKLSDAKVTIKATSSKLKAPQKSKGTPKPVDDDDDGDGPPPLASSSDDDSNYGGKKSITTTKSKAKPKEKNDKSITSTSSGKPTNKKSADFTSKAAVSSSKPPEVPIRPPPITQKKYPPIHVIKKYKPKIVSFFRRLKDMKLRKQLKGKGDMNGPWRPLVDELFKGEYAKVFKTATITKSWNQILLAMNTTKKISDVDDDTQELIRYDEALQSALDKDSDTKVAGLSTTESTSKVISVLNEEVVSPEPKIDDDDDNDYDETTVGAIELPKDLKQRVNKILISHHIKDWMRTVGAQRLIDMFLDRLNRLAAGDCTSYAMAKPLKFHPSLKHCTKTSDSFNCVILESKLDRGQRILYSVERFKETDDSEAKEVFLIWYVSKHDNVSRMITLIDQAFQRKVTDVIRDKFFDFSGQESSKKDDEHSIMLVDPGTNNVMRTYWLRPSEIEYLGTDWKPPLQLTIHEINIVNRDHSVLLLGRGGTGKTYCLCSRIHRDQVMYNYKNIRCLFVAYTDRLKDSVKYIYENMCSGQPDTSSTIGRESAVDDADGSSLIMEKHEGSDDVVTTAGFTDWQRGKINRNNTLDYYRMRLLIRRIYDDDISNDRPIRFPEARYVDFRVFKEAFWKVYLEKVDKKLKLSSISEKDPNKKVYIDAVTAWTQIYSFIKGSVDTFKVGEVNSYGRRELSRDVYIDTSPTAVIAQNRSRIDTEHRERAYKIYEHYRIWMGEDVKGWDETDIVMAVLQHLNEQLCNGNAPKYHKIYVDEVQDFTQAEIAVLILASGRDSKALFMAGDSAQSINTGVAFRFEDVRSCFDKLKPTNSKDKMDKKETLTTNFRSHQGILKVANIVLSVAKEFYKGCLDNLLPDFGLANGPAPGLLQDISYEDIARICICNPKLKLLTWDSNEKYLKAQLDIARQSLLDKLLQSQTATGQDVSREEQTRIENTRFFVYGFRAVKGLEFESVAIVDFFTYEQDKVEAFYREQAAINTSAIELLSQPEDDLTPDIQKAWKYFFEKFSYDHKVKLGEETGITPPKEPDLCKNGARPMVVEIQFKILYTAITRARASLFLIERVCKGNMYASAPWFKFLLDFKLATKMPLSSIATDINKTVMLPDEWRYEGVSTITELITEDTDTKTAIQILQEGIVSFYQSNMSENDPLFCRGMTHLKALKARELLEERTAHAFKMQTSNSAASALLAASLASREITEVTVPPVNFKFSVSGLLKTARDQCNDFLKKLYPKDNEYVAAEACLCYFELGMYEELNALFSLHCASDRPIVGFTRRVTNYFDENSRLNKTARTRLPKN